MNRLDRLQELVIGGPYDVHQWAVMVHLAYWANDQGLVKPPNLAHLMDWVGGSEKLANWTIRRLTLDGWVTETDNSLWDISGNLRQGSHAHTQ